MSKNKKRILATIMLILWMGVIFWFSAQIAEDSTKQSMGIVEIIKNILGKLFPATESMSEEAWHHFENFLRKCAHGFIYFILGLLSCNFSKSYSFRFEKSIAVAICFIYAVSDEIHQLFVPGRSGQVSDVIVDLIGSLIGIVLFALIKRRNYEEN